MYRIFKQQAYILAQVVNRQVSDAHPSAAGYVAFAYGPIEHR